MLFVIDILGDEEIKSECDSDKESRDKELEIKKREFLYEIARRAPALQIVER
jgi:hypothetical protein